MDEIMERAMLAGETLGWFDWLRPKPKSATAQITDLNSEIRALIQKVNLKKAQVRRLYSQARAAAPRAASRPKPQQRVSMPAYVQAALARARAQVVARKPMTRTRGLSPAERAEYNKRMMWGWAQRPGAPDMPGERAAKTRNYAQYKQQLSKKVQAIILRKRNMGWAGRPGAPDRPGEAAAKMRRAGVYLGDDTLEALDEELLL